MILERQNTTNTNEKCVLMYSRECQCSDWLQALSHTEIGDTGSKSVQRSSTVHILQGSKSPYTTNPAILLQKVEYSAPVGLVKMAWVADLDGQTMATLQIVLDTQWKIIRFSCSSFWNCYFQYTSQYHPSLASKLVRQNLRIQIFKTLFTYSVSKITSRTYLDDASFNCNVTSRIHSYCVAQL